MRSWWWMRSSTLPIYVISLLPHIKWCDKWLQNSEVLINNHFSLLAKKTCNHLFMATCCCFRMSCKWKDILQAAYLVGLCFCCMWVQVCSTYVNFLAQDEGVKEIHKRNSFSPETEVAKNLLDKVSEFQVHWDPFAKSAHIADTKVKGKYYTQPLLSHGQDHTRNIGERLDLLEQMPSNIPILTGNNLSVGVELESYCRGMAWYTFRTKMSHSSCLWFFKQILV